MGPGAAQLPVLAPRRRAQAVGGVPALRRARARRAATTSCATSRARCTRSSPSIRDFEPLHEPESNILCFRWVGDGSHGDEALDAFNRELRESYNRSGAGWITATTLDGRRVLRVTIMNPRTTEADLAEIIAGLERQAELMRAQH